MRDISYEIRKRIAGNRALDRTTCGRAHPPLPRPEQARDLTAQRWDGVKGTYLEIANVNRYQSNDGSETMGVWTQDPAFPFIGDVKRVVVLKDREGNWNFV